MRGIWCFKRPAVGEQTEQSASDPVDGPPQEDDLSRLQRINPVVRTYIYPSDALSARRYFLLYCAVVGGFIWWLGPFLGIFMFDPLIQLILLDTSVITPVTDCFDHRLANQTCDSDVMVDYYFWNITNQEEWASGAGPPQYTEVGPYAFRAKEIRYNVEYNANWTEVAFTYHQWAEFMPEKSCASCTMDDQITGVNRAYLQFLASAPASAPVDPESGVIYQIMPTTLAVIRESMRAAVYSANPASTTVNQDALRQWVDCSLLQPLAPIWGLSTPYLKSIPLPPGVSGFPFDPELCAYIPGAVLAYSGATVTPADFSAYGLALDYTAAETFLNLAIGQTNLTYIDPTAQQFLGAFLTLPQATVLGLVGSFSPPAAEALGLITSTQWLILQGYLSSLVPSWGTLVYSQWLESGDGGLLLTKPVSSWMYGFVDPLLVAGAQGAAAATGDPTAYLLAPWTFMPSLGLTFATKDDPINYFESVTGNPYNFSMLSWNSSRPGFFHPLIQQKRMQTGKGKGTVPQDILQYRGLSFSNKTWGLVNTTGISEGVAFGSGVDATQQFLTWDSVLSRPIMAEFSGYETEVKKVRTLIFNMTPPSVEACNWTRYADWAGAAGFDPDAYRAAFASISPQQYWSLIENDTALAEHFRDGPLGANLGEFYSKVDVGVDRCAVPDAFASLWDMSALLACPTIYTFPRFYDADEAVVATTGINASTWAPNLAEHSYSLAVEPFTGYALKGHKTYQVNHLVSPSVNLYPNLWAAPGSGAAAGLPADFVTVPVFWVRMWWEPTDSIALVIRAITKVESVLYYLLVVTWPVLGWLMLGPSLFILAFGKDAKVRKKALPELQKSRARAARLTAHAKEMNDALTRRARGSFNVNLPQALVEGTSEAAEADLELGSHNRTRELVEESRAVLRAGSSSGSKEAPLLGHDIASGSSSGGSEAPLLWQKTSSANPASTSAAGAALPRVE